VDEIALGIAADILLVETSKVFKTFEVWQKIAAQSPGRRQCQTYIYNRI